MWYFLDIAVPGSSSKWEEVQSKAKHLLLNTFGMYKCTIQLQSYRQEMNRTCANCQSSSTWFYVLEVYSLIYPTVTDLRAINLYLMESLTAVSMSSTGLTKTVPPIWLILHDFRVKFPKYCLQSKLSLCRYLIEDRPRPYFIHLTEYPRCTGRLRIQYFHLKLLFYRPVIRSQC